MDRLPDEVMLMIFEWILPCKLLGAVSQVCRRWASLVAHRALLLKHENELQRCHQGLHGVRVLNRQTTIMINKLFEFRNLRDITICSATPLSSDCFKALIHLEQLDHLDVFLDGRPLDASMLPTLGG
ncbi:unnamed protein product [Diatraea saccharalis]|uniref:F-box domain-containing protein n=1 Tax=Diatraea saccharalis TaxID=40085 RepID=A0A9N9WFT9_9NEOP|nr:unnamed protein product [Diatraea saccharalis]